MKNLKKCFVDVLGAELSKVGFGKFRSQLASDQGSAVVRRVHVSFIPQKKGEHATLEATVDMAVRYEAIEQAIEEWKRKELAEEPVSSATLGVELGQLLNGKQKRYPLTSEAEAADSALAAYADLVNVGLPYLAKCCDVRSVIDRFSSDNFRHWHQTLSGAAFRLPLLYLSVDETDVALKCFDKMQEKLNATNDYHATHYASFREHVLTGHEQR